MHNIVQKMLVVIKQRCPRYISLISVAMNWVNYGLNVGYKSENLGMQGCGHNQIKLLFQYASKTIGKFERNEDATESDGFQIGKRVLKYKKVDVLRLLQPISNRL